jgi:hypothetical protein
LARFHSAVPQSSPSENILLEQLALQDWQACINHSEEIVSIFQHWHPSYFALVSPMSTAWFWFNCCLLSRHIMHCSGESSLPAAESARLESAVDLLTVSLQRFSEHRSIANLLLGKLSSPPPPILSLVSLMKVTQQSRASESVKELHLWTWFKTGFSDLLSRFQTPLDPNNKDPTKFSTHHHHHQYAAPASPIHQLVVLGEHHSGRIYLRPSRPGLTTLKVCLIEGA